MNRERHHKYKDIYPHYKVQYWDGISICWIDLQRKFPDPEKADRFAQMFARKFGSGMKYRIIEVQRDERHPYQPKGQEFEATGSTDGAVAESNQTGPTTSST